MKRFIFSLIFIVPVAGCSVLTLDYNELNYLDGINPAEAKLIAQQRLIDTSLKHSYKVGSPQVLTGTDAKAYPDYWFVSFSGKLFTRRHSSNYLVAIDKETGEILRSRIWYPERMTGLDWVFE